MNKETLRMQMLAGVITEGQYKVKLQEFDMNQFSMGNSSSPKASFEDKWNDVPNANKEILKKSTGKEPVKIMASSKGENYVITKGSDGKFYTYKYTQAENPGKPMGPFNSENEAKKLNESLKESMIGGIVGIGAINQIPPREKTDYELAFEHFLGNKYGLKENEEIITPKTLANYIMDMIELADDMEYTSEMVDELENLKNTLSGGSMSKEDALKVMQKTIDITGDEIDAAEALNQAISGDYKLNERETKFENREQDPYTMKEAEMPAVDSRIKNDANFQKLTSYFKQNPDKAEDVKDELSSLKEAYEKDGKYYDEDEYGDKKEITFKKYLIAKLVNIGLPAAVLGLVGALMAGPLGVMAPGEILQAIGIAAGIGGAAGAALDYGETKPIGEVEEKVNEGKLDGLYMELKDVLFPYYTDLRGEERVSMIDDVIKELNSYISILQNEKRAKQ
jgi:hypothetical protein